MSDRASGKPGAADLAPGLALADTHISEPGASSSTVDPTASGRAPRTVGAGDVVGRYELIEEVGEGGMATVFRARDRELRRDVAVKVLFPHLAKRTEIVRRFHREARAAAGLEHPNIMRIYDVGGAGEVAPDDPPYIVMELIPGRTLLDEIEQRGALLAELVACVGALLADALAAAHRAGIVHRDIKPANVLIAGNGRLALADFGVARFEDDASVVTRTGALLGTPAYMSPEQATGETVTARSDLYSLGATLYQLATGALPYTGNPAKVISMIASGQLVAPVRRSAQVGPDLSRAIERLMAADPAHRPASAVEVANELRALAAPLGEPADELAAYFGDPSGFITAHTPTIVSELVTAGRRAIADNKLARAIAIADRASALAPDDPTVAQLVDAVTARNHQGRRRTVTLALAGVVLAGGAAAYVAFDRSRSADPTALDATAVTGDRVAVVDSALAVDPADAASGGIDAAEVMLDAASDRVDAAPRLRDASTARPPADARISEPAAVIDAGEPATVDAAVATTALEDGMLDVTTDTWCDLSIDGVVVRNFQSAGRLAIAVKPGAHDVVCAQTRDKWSQRVHIEPAKTSTIRITLLSAIAVTIATGGDRVEIDRSRYAPGGIVKLRPGRYEVWVYAGSQLRAHNWVAVPNQPCRLVETSSGITCDP